MADKEKVVDGLRCCSEMSGEYCRKCPYQGECRHGYGIPHLANDALELLEEQEKQNEPLAPEIETQNDVDVLYRCPACHKYLFYRFQKYCCICGQAVKWK